MQEITCPSCQGSGGGNALLNMGRPQGCIVRWMDCRTCKGAKVVSQEQVDAIELGKRFTVWRRGKDLSMGEFVEQYKPGVDKFTLSQIEQGRVPMPDSIKELIICNPTT